MRFVENQIGYGLNVYSLPAGYTMVGADQASGTVWVREPGGETIKTTHKYLVENNGTPPARTEGER